MLFFGKPLSEVNEDDLLALIENAVQESKTLDFKRELPGNADEHKREYLADISAFSNASGGFIVFGMDEKKGEAFELVGLDIEDSDKEILRLNSIAESSIEPRIPSLNFKSVTLSSGEYVIIASISKSWTAPHVVKFRKHWRFYSRNSAGKHPLEVAEVRNIIVASETLQDRIRRFRAERIANIVADETPSVLLQYEPKVILTTIPLSAFDQHDQMPIREIAKNNTIKQDIGHYRWRYNVDGLLGFLSDQNNGKYTQIFRNGIMEYVDSGLISHRSTERKIIPSTLLERDLILMLSAFISIYQSTGVEPPIVVFLSMLGFKGYNMAHKFSFGVNDVFPIDRENLILPEMLVESFSEQAHTILRPLLDAVWNASSWDRSPNYDEGGNWRSH